MFFLLVLQYLSLGTVNTKRIPLVVFGVDGYGWELYQKYGDKSSGAKNVLPLRPVFPTKTFPNFFSIATGLYPTQHGIIGNSFYNQKEEMKFSYEDSQSKYFNWYRGEPIWITAKKAGLRTYVDMWVGSTAKYNGLRPDYFFYYDGSKKTEKKIQGITANIKSSDRCDLYMLYTSQPDYALHRMNMSNITHVREIISKAESEISLVKDGLDKTGIEYNLVIVSDHGFSYYTRVYNLSYTYRNKAERFYGGPIGYWYSKFGDVSEETAEDINSYLKARDIHGMTANLTSSLAPRYQLCGLDFEGKPDIFLMTEDGLSSNTYWDQYSGHGYDNEYTSMLSQLRVYGPAFKKYPMIGKMNYSMVTEVYNLFCTLLEIEPVNNTGHTNTFDLMIHDPPDRRTTWKNYGRLHEPCYNDTLSSAKSHAPLIPMLLLVIGSLGIN